MDIRENESDEERRARLHGNYTRYYELFKALDRDEDNYVDVNELEHYFGENYGNENTNRSHAEVQLSDSVVRFMARVCLIAWTKVAYYYIARALVC